MLESLIGDLHYLLREAGDAVFYLKVALAAILAVVAVYKVLALYGFFTNANLYRETLPRMRVLYLSRRGGYEGNQQFYYKVKKVVGQTFKISKYIGVYYDDPATTDAAQCRSILGVIVNEGEYHKIPKFLEDNPAYTQATIKPTEAYACTFPLINSLSLLVAQSRVMPHARKIEQEREGAKVSSYLIEIYNEVPTFFSKTITIAKVADGFENFQLWKEDEKKDQ